MVCQTSASVRRTFHLAPAVITYGLDGRAVRRELSSGSDGLDLETFLAKLYVPRPGIELAVEPQIGKPLAIWLAGKAGTGKTSLAYRLIVPYLKRCGLPLIVLDFRVHGGSFSRPNGTRQSPDGQTSAVVSPGDLSAEKVDLARQAEFARAEDNWNSLLNDAIASASRLAGSSWTHCSDHELATHLLALTSIDPSLAVTHGLAAQCLQLYSRYDNYRRRLGPSSQAKNITEWAQAHLWGSAETPDRDIIDRLQQLGDSIGAPERLLAIRERSGSTQLPIVLLDNLDNITDIAFRRAVANWCRNEAERLKDHAQFIICVRPENAVFFSPVPIAPPPSDGELVMSSAGTHLQFVFGVRPDIMPSGSEALLTEIAGAIDFPSFWESDDSLDPTTAMGRHAAFEARIIRARLEYLRSCLANTPDGGEHSASDTQALANVLHETFTTRSINRDIVQMACGSKRSSYALLLNFTEWLFVEHAGSWSSLGSKLTEMDPKTARRLSLSSLYFRWIATAVSAFEDSASAGSGNGASKRDRGKSDVMDHRSFAITNWVERCGWRGDQLVLDTKYSSYEAQACAALAPLYTLILLYNLGGNTLGQRKGRDVMTAHLAGRLSLVLGVEESHVYDYLTESIQAGSAYEHGMFESSRIIEILSGHRLSGREDELVSLSDRGCHIIEYTCVVFHFLSRRLEIDADPSAKDVSPPSEYFDGLIRGSDLKRLLSWLRRAITSELLVVSKIGKGSARAGMDAYTKNFAISGTRGQLPALWTHRIVRSSLAYVDHVLNGLPAARRPHEVTQYRRELSDLDWALTGMLSGHYPWDLVPRDAPFTVHRGS